MTDDTPPVDTDKEARIRAYANFFYRQIKYEGGKDSTAALFYGTWLKGLGL